MCLNSSNTLTQCNFASNAWPYIGHAYLQLAPWLCWFPWIGWLYLMGSRGHRPNLYPCITLSLENRRWYLSWQILALCKQMKISLSKLMLRRCGENPELPTLKITISNLRQFIIKAVIPITVITRVCQSPALYYPKCSSYPLIDWIWLYCIKQHWNYSL